MSSLGGGGGGYDRCIIPINHVYCDTTLRKALLSGLPDMCYVLMIRDY